MKIEIKEDFIEEEDLIGPLRLLDFYILRIEEVIEGGKNLTNMNKSVYDWAGCTSVAPRRHH